LIRNASSLLLDQLSVVSSWQQHLLAHLESRNTNPFISRVFRHFPEYFCFKVCGKWKRKPKNRNGSRSARF
ncbi:AAEL005498-PA, partial [Aedes aegypti]